MQRLLVAALAAVDAAIAAAVGLAVLLAPLTLLWVVMFGMAGDWGALWPTTATLWQFGHAVPLAVTIPDELLRSLGIPEDAARFVVSLAPLAFLGFTLLFAGRSGARAVRAGAWISGVAGGAIAFTALAVGVALTGALEVAEVALASAIGYPALVYLAGALAGAIGTAWRHGDGGAIDRIRAWVEDYHEWGAVPEGVVRGAATAVVALLGLGGLLLAARVFARMGDIVALYESLGVDALGATVISLGQLAYVPTLVVWAVAWMAGPGIAVGTGTSVSPVGTELGVVPAIPMLGVLPENTSMWMLIVVLLPVGAGAFAGWVIRSRLVSLGEDPRMLPRAAIALGIAVLVAGSGAALARLASGSIGPGRMAEVGPHPGLVALALGAEVLIGAAILLLSPRHRDELAAEAPGSAKHWREGDVGIEGSEDETAPVDLGFLGDGEPPETR